MPNSLQEHILIRAFAEVERRTGTTSNASGVEEGAPRQRLARLAVASLERQHGLPDPAGAVAWGLVALRVAGALLALSFLAAGFRLLSGYVFTGRSLPVFGLLLLLALALIPPLAVLVLGLLPRLFRRRWRAPERGGEWLRLLLPRRARARRAAAAREAAESLALAFTRNTLRTAHRLYETAVVCFWIGAGLALIRPWWDTRISDYEWSPAVSLRARVAVLEACRFVPAAFRPGVEHIAYADKQNRGRYYWHANPRPPAFNVSAEPMEFLDAETPVTASNPGNKTMFVHLHLRGGATTNDLPLVRTAREWAETPSSVVCLACLKLIEFPVSPWMRANTEPADYSRRWFAFINWIVFLGLAVRLGLLALASLRERLRLRELDEDLRFPPFCNYLNALSPAPAVPARPSAPLVEAPGRPGPVLEPTIQAAPVVTGPVRVVGYRRPVEGAILPAGDTRPWPRVVEDDASREAFAAVVETEPGTPVCMVVDLSVPPEAEVGEFLRRLHARAPVRVALQNHARFAGQRGADAAEARVRRWRDLLAGVGIPENGVSLHE